jgi:hypothetical protein
MAGHRDGKAGQHEKRCEEEGEFSHSVKPLKYLSTPLRYWEGISSFMASKTFSLKAWGAW